MSMVYVSDHEFRRAMRFMNGNALAHFRLRASNWAMAIVNVSVGLVMTANPGVLTNNPSANIFFSHLLPVVSPDMWRNLFVTMGALRLAALYINGTFPSIWWTPHIRLMMALLSFFVWTQFAVSIIMSWVLTIGTVLYCATVTVEFYNVISSANEAFIPPERDIE